MHRGPIIWTQSFGIWTMARPSSLSQAAAIKPDDDGASDETKFDMLRLPDAFGWPRICPGRKVSARILRRAEFPDEELHRCRQVAAHRHTEHYGCQRYDL